MNCAVLCYFGMYRAVLYYAALGCAVLFLLYAALGCIVWYYAAVGCDVLF